MRPFHRHRQLGLSLVESLVAFAVAMIGMTALFGTESRLRLHADLARQRAQAVRLAQQEIERLRSFTTIDELRALPLSASQDVDDGSSAHFSLEQKVEPDTAPGVVTAQVDVRWKDRQGHDTTVTLRSLVAALDPALSGEAVSRTMESSRQAPLGRSSFIPLQAADLGDGRSRFEPPGAAGIAWIFDNASGMVTGACTPSAGGASASPDCGAVTGLVVSGHVRFATGPTASLADAAQPASPVLALDMQLQLQQGSASCFQIASATDIAYHCLVTPPAGQTRWSGRLGVVPRGWTLRHDAQGFRVCRYAPPTAAVANTDHPLDYHEVDTPLAHQNFLVIRGDHPCPASAASHDADESSTVEQAPDPQAGTSG